jgi:hypothetical protein
MEGGILTKRFAIESRRWPGDRHGRDRCNATISSGSTVVGAVASQTGSSDTSCSTRRSFASSDRLLSAVCDLSLYAQHDDQLLVQSDERKSIVTSLSSFVVGFLPRHLCRCPIRSFDSTSAASSSGNAHPGKLSTAVPCIVLFTLNLQRTCQDCSIGSRSPPTAPPAQASRSSTAPSTNFDLRSPAKFTKARTSYGTINPRWASPNPPPLLAPQPTARNTSSQPRLP